MKRIFIFPSIDEAKEFLLTGTKAPVFVAGGSTAEMAACIVRAVRSKRARHLVLAGFAPSCDGALAPGTVVEVVTACDPTAPDGRCYETSGPDLGLPLAAGRVPGADFRPEERPETGQPAGTSETGMQAGDTTGDTTGGTTGDTTGSTTVEAPEEASEALPEVASRDGALLFALAEALEVEASEVRVIVGPEEAPEAAEERQHAARLLAEALQEAFGEEEPAAERRTGEAQ